MRRAVRPAALAVALSLWVIAARASAGSLPPATTVTPAPSASPMAPAQLSWEVVSSIPHDTQAFTQGLLIDDVGRLFETTGLEGRSTIRELDRATGDVLRLAELPEGLFGEGVAVAGDHLLQLTWTEGVALAWDPDTFELLGTYRYEGEGWGICEDGGRLVMSDGSATLDHRDPVTFEVLGTLDVTAAGVPVADLNELECVGGEVYANVWQTPHILRIDGTTGVVTGVLDMTGLIEPDPSVVDPGAVLNGIAHDAQRGTFLITGKLWPTMFEIRITGA